MQTFKEFLNESTDRKFKESPSGKHPFKLMVHKGKMWGTNEFWSELVFKTKEEMEKEKKKLKSEGYKDLDSPAIKFGL